MKAVILANRLGMRISQAPRLSLGSPEQNH